MSLLFIFMLVFVFPLCSSFTGDWYKTYDSCEAALAANRSQSGQYYIGKPTNSVSVKCEMQADTVKTTISHATSNKLFNVTGFEGSSSYNQTLSYNQNFNSIINIIDASSRCQQMVKIKCQHSVISGVSYLTNRANQKMDCWAGGPPNGQGCECGISGTCANSRILCNCDANDYVIRTDDGYVTRKSDLPITSISTGDTGEAPEYKEYMIGDVECFSNKRAIVSCTDNYIRVELDTKYFNASKYGSITLRHSNCTASFSRDYITLGSVLNGCGATMTESNDEIIFENEVIMKAKTSRSDMISRDHDQSVDIRCVYKRSGFVGVSFDPIMQYSGYEEGIGSFTFNFAMYESETFARRHYSYPVKVNTRDRLFFQASAIVKDNGLTLLIDQCYSTPNMNRWYHKKYMIIDNGCPMDSTVQFHRGDRQNHRFSMDAFRYLGNSTTVYIHCLLFLCHKTSSVGKCRSGCDGNNLNRVKRDVNEQSNVDESSYSKFYLLELGPVTLKKDEKKSKDSGGRNELDVKFIVLSVGIAALAVIVVALLIKRRRPEENQKKIVKEIGIDNAPNGDAYVVGDEACAKGEIIDEAM